MGREVGKAVDSGAVQAPRTQRPPPPKAASAQVSATSQKLCARPTTPNPAPHNTTQPTAHSNSATFRSAIAKAQGKPSCRESTARYRHKKTVDISWIRGFCKSEDLVPWDSSNKRNQSRTAKDVPSYAQRGHGRLPGFEGGRTVHRH